MALNFLPGAKVTDLRELESKRTCIKGSATRTAEDIETSQSFNMSEVKAIASDNPLILEKAQADQDLSVLESLATAHRRSQTQTRQAVDAANTAISSYSRRIPALNDAIVDRTETKGDAFRATVAGQVFTERVEAANA
ncbi:MAG TPA: hypothetical protein DIU42_05850, partial [Dermacoccus sp.]|nr:hypothetical protein [Dermacoccus sp.]